MSAAQGALEELTRGRRTNHFLDVKVAAKSLDIHPNKVSDWIYRTGEKIKLLYRDQPGLMAAQMALWAAEAEADRQTAAEPKSRIA